MTRFPWRWFVCNISIWIIGVLIISAQEVTPEVENATELVSAQFIPVSPTVYIGEPIDITLFVWTTEGYVLRGWPEFPREWSAFEVLKISDINVSDDERQYSQTITVVIWRTGEHRTPTTFISAENITTGRIERFRVEPATIFVPSILNTDDLNLRPFREPVDVFYIHPLIIISISIICVLGGYRASVAWRQHQKPLATKVEEPVKPLRQAIETLQALDTNQQTSAMVVHLSVENILKSFLEEQFSLTLHDQTTREIISLLSDRLTRSHKEGLERLLSQIDLVKFADLEAHNDDANRLIISALKWLQSFPSEINSNG